MRLIPVLALLGMLCTQSVAADDAGTAAGFALDGTTLVKYCKLEHRATCRGFVSGVLSAAYALGVTGYCIPETETIEDIIDTVVH